MIDVIDVGEIGQLARGELVLGREEPPVPRIGTEPAKQPREAVSVPGAEWPQPEHTATTNPERVNLRRADCFSLAPGTLAGPS